MNMWKPKLKHKTIYNHSKENKIGMSVIKHACWKLEYVSEINQRKPK